MALSKNEDIVIMVIKMIGVVLTFVSISIWFLSLLGEFIYRLIRKRKLKHMSLLKNRVVRVIFLLQLATFIEITQFFFEFVDLHNHSVICYYQGIVVQYFGIAKVCWSVGVAVWALYLIALRKKKNFRLKVAIELILLVFGLVFPLIVTVIPLAFSEIGEASGYCWIKGTKTGNILRIVTFYVPLWLGIVVVYILYTLTVIILCGTQVKFIRSSESPGHIRHMIIRSSGTVYILLLGFPLVFLVHWIGSTLFRVHESISGGISFWLYCLHSLNPYQGFWNTIVWFFALSWRITKIREFWMRIMSCHCLRRKKKLVFKKRKDIVFTMSSSTVDYTSMDTPSEASKRLSMYVDEDLMIGEDEVLLTREEQDFEMEEPEL